MAFRYDGLAMQVQGNARLRVCGAKTLEMVNKGWAAGRMALWWYASIRVPVGRFATPYIPCAFECFEPRSLHFIAALHKMET